MWNIHQSQSMSMPSHKNTCRVTTSLLLTPVCPTLLEEFEKPRLRKREEKKRLLEETTADGTYFPPKVSRLSRGREASLSLNVGQSFDCGNGHFSY